MDGWGFLEAKQRCGKANPKELLNEGRLAAACRVGGDEGELVPIPQSAWSKIAVDEERPDLLHHENGAVFQDLRVFPVLHAPNVADLLHDQSLADVFMSFVVRDPEVSVLGALVVAQRGHPEIFAVGMAPGPVIDYHWAIDKKAEELAFDFVRPIGFFLEDPIPRPSAAITAVAEVLTVRIAALRRLLASGRLNALGTHWNTGTLGPVHRVQWLRANQAIEVQNGDLCEYQNPKYFPTWTGILLERGGDNPGRSDLFDELIRRPDGRVLGRQTIRAESLCKGWLAQLMRNHPQGRVKPKTELFLEAEQKWSIGKRAFDRAWAAASAESEAGNWRSGGRPRKTPAAKTSAPE
jgi:hypothetical protein